MRHQQKKPKIVDSPVRPEKTSLGKPLVEKQLLELPKSVLQEEREHLDDRDSDVHRDGDVHRDDTSVPNATQEVSEVLLDCSSTIDCI